MVVFTYIAAGIILLGVCIFVHELGHLLGGKMVGIKAKTFSMGYGKGIHKENDRRHDLPDRADPLRRVLPVLRRGPLRGAHGQGVRVSLRALHCGGSSPWRWGRSSTSFFGIIIFFVMNLVGYYKDTNRVHIPESLHDGQARFAGLRGRYQERRPDREDRRQGDRELLRHPGRGPLQRGRAGSTSRWSATGSRCSSE